MQLVNYGSVEIETHFSISYLVASLVLFATVCVSVILAVLCGYGVYNLYRRSRSEERTSRKLILNVIIINEIDIVFQLPMQSTSQ